MTGIPLIAATGTDMGRRRTNNEDLAHVDAARGLFIVIDGVGGHAAGETAAATALEVLKERLEREVGSPEQRLREAIALANNEIHRLAGTNPEWNGMACVLTIALVEDGVVHVGHVGDSRLYLLRPGFIEKKTSDHSPVGEREDRGELSETDAMRHPRRNEIFRDVGSEDRTPDDPNFIEITNFPMPADGALLLCSDGLTDLVEKATIAAGMELYAPDYDAAIQALIRAANDAGGKDNITIAVAAAPGYGKTEAVLPVALPTSFATKAGGGSKSRTRWGVVAAGVVAGMLLGAAGVAGWVYGTRPVPVVGPRTWKVPADGAIQQVLRVAKPKDTVLIAAGTYAGPVMLSPRVAVRADGTGEVVLTSTEPGPIVVAANVAGALLEGVTVRGTRGDSDTTGIDIVGSDVVIRDVQVERAYTGILVHGDAAPLITLSRIVDNLATGLEIRDTAHPSVEKNVIARNGKAKPGPEKPGIDIRDLAKPVLHLNAVFDNGAEPVWIEVLPEYPENLFAGPAPRTTHKLKSHKTADKTSSPKGDRQ